MNQQAPIATLALPTDPKSVEAFWTAVSETLEVVLHKADFVSIANAARARLEGASAETQLLFYHASPFQVATDLAGEPIAELGAVDLDAYRTIIERFEPSRYPPT